MCDKMKIRFQEFHGVKYLVPVGFEFLDKKIMDYPSFCGAGKGIGDKIVPEFIGGMRCAHICHGHDNSWDAAEFTFFDFLLSNVMFAYNLLVYLATGKGGVIKRIWRAIKGSAYVLAVSTIGWKIFKNLKSTEKQ